MTSLKLIPRHLSGSIHVPPSKSMSHRAILCAALAKGESKISHLIYSDDVVMTLNAMADLGAVICREDDGVRICGIGSLLGDKLEKTLYCKESGSTLRFLIPIAAALGGSTKFTGSGRLVERPLTAYLNILRSQGIPHHYDGRLPLEIKGRLRGEDFIVDGGESSQYISGLLMAMPLMGESASVTVSGDFESEDYVKLTCEMMARFGQAIVTSGRRFELSSQVNQGYQPCNYRVEADYSQGAFFLVAGQIGKAIHCDGLEQTSKQADRRIMDIIKMMGGNLEETSSGIVSHPTKTKGTIIDAAQCPDIIPVLCVLAALSEGRTEVINGQRLRIKESDRIKATVSELSKLGANITETHDGMVIEGVKMLKGGTVEGWQDHRIVMALAIASIRCEMPVVINGADAVGKSYPHFFEDFKKLGGHYEQCIRT